MKKQAIPTSLLSLLQPLRLALLAAVSLALPQTRATLLLSAREWQCSPSATIKSISYHFIDRTVGSIYYTYTKDGEPIKHEGVSVEGSLKILSEGKARGVVYDSYKRASQKYILKGVGDVTINPETGELIQVNKDG